MSEEEIIKYLKNVIKTIQESDMLFDEPANIRCGIKMKGAIQGLLDLYNKEREKNKELFEEYNKRVATIIKYEQEIKEIIDKIDVEDYYCLNKAEEDLRKLINYYN